MSLVTELFEGKLSPQDFVVQAAADVKKDLGWWSALPFAATVEEWAIAALEKLLSTKLSPTLSALIANEIRQLLHLPAGS